MSYVVLVPPKITNKQACELVDACITAGVFNGCKNYYRRGGRDRIQSYGDDKFGWPYLAVSNDGMNEVCGHASSSGVVMETPKEFFLDLRDLEL